eukprot:8310719-Pyramimonas_sp.AAC.1
MGPSQRGTGSGRLGSDGLAWNRILGQMTEIQLQEPTHHCAAQGGPAEIGLDLCVCAGVEPYSVVHWRQGARLP